MAWAALRQAATARHRHEQQTDADRQRRISESFSKATEQLGSAEIAVRLGGIYTLERISRESPVDYLTVMETLTAFVRERARWEEGKEPLRPATDIAAVLAVIVRRIGRDLESKVGIIALFNFSYADLRNANFCRTYLETAVFTGAHLEGAGLIDAHLKGAFLPDAHLEGAN